MSSCVYQPYRNLQLRPVVIVSQLGTGLARFRESLLAAVCTKWIKVKGESMSPTLADGTWVRVDRRAYKVHGPCRFDVVLLEHPHRPGFAEVKRVVGLPGEHVVLDPKGLQVDGVRTPQPVATTRASRGGWWRLAADEYVVLGDNRERSTDSREFGAVNRRHIKGRVVLRGVTPLRCV